MAALNLPLLIEPKDLQPHLDDGRLVIVSLCRADLHNEHHIKGAIHLEFSRIIQSNPPVMGLLPDQDILVDILSGLGISNNTHVIAYDDEGGGKACRLLWTLDAIGHKNFSLLNGGLHAWVNENHPTASKIDSEKTSASDNTATYNITMNNAAMANKAYILAHIKDANCIFLDARTASEYDGSTVRAQRGGHIPGAINIDWSTAIDQGNNLRLKGKDELLALLAQHAITPDKEIITYCHTHHRSAHTYIMLKILGFTQVRGYPGSWSEWGNDEGLPIEK